MDKFKILVTILLFVIAIFIMLLFVDLITTKQVKIERVKCIDDVGAKFIDEWCDKEIYCSWLGLRGERCKNGR